MDTQTIPSVIKLHSSVDVSGFRVLSFEGEETISRGFEYTLNVHSGDGRKDLSDLLGKMISVAMNVHTVDEIRKNAALASENRFVTGFVRNVTLGDRGDLDFIYSITLQSPLSFLRFRRNTRIFHDMTLSEIIRVICGEHKIMMDCSREISIKTATKKIEYCVQYDETDFDFLSRLMEEYGVWYCYRHAEKAIALMISDDMGKFVPSPVISELRFQRARNEDQFRTVWNSPAVKDELYTIQRQESSVAGSYSTSDYLFTVAARDLYTKVQGTAEQLLPETGIHEYPGNITPDDSNAVSSRRMEEIEVPANIIHGQSFSRSLIAGFTFNLKDHPLDTFNIEYLVTSLRIEATTESFTNTFEAIPKSVRYRPSRITTKPRIYGYLSAVVVGVADSDEIYTDRYGRILARFQWNNSAKSNDNTTMFIRVAQIWAGKGYGTMFVPRVGMEVIVAFLDGDPDRPVVIGTLYNSEQTIPYTQPDNKDTATWLSRSTPKGKAGNELKLVDKKDAELLYMHAQKDWEALVENDKKTTVKHDETLEVLNNRSIMVKKKEEHVVEDTRSLTVKGDSTESYSKNQKISVQQNYSLKVSGDLSIEVTGNISIKGANISIESNANTDIKANTNFSAAANVNASMKGNAEALVDGGAQSTLSSKGIATVKGSLVKIN